MSSESELKFSQQTVLVTGSARRLGAAMIQAFHEQGARVAVHYHHSKTAAHALVDELNQSRPDREGSAVALQADLADLDAIQRLAEQAVSSLGSVSLLINNASAFFPTPVGSVSGEDWDQLHDSNLKGAFFLIQALLPELRRQKGCVINMLDIHASRPLGQHAAYTAAKAGLAMLTANLALDLAPGVRVNGIAPGAILWPEGEAEPDDSQKQKKLSKIPLHRLGGEEAIVEAALYLAGADYVTGEILTVDGGRRLNG